MTPHFTVIYHDLSQTKYSFASSDLDIIQTHSPTCFTAIDQRFTAVPGLLLSGDPISKE